MVGCVNFFEFFFIKGGGNELFMLSATSGSAWSEHDRCPGQRKALAPVVRGGGERHHLLSRVARSVYHPFSGSTRKRFLNQTPYKRCTKLFCSVGET